MRHAHLLRPEGCEQFADMQETRLGMSAGITSSSASASRMTFTIH
jgi:hypothetical protein